MDHYSKLSAEAARREQKALWKIQRHRLAGARLRFLSEDREHVEVLGFGGLRTPVHPFGVGALVTLQLLTTPSDRGAEHCLEAQAAGTARPLPLRLRVVGTQAGRLPRCCLTCGLHCRRC